MSEAAPSQARASAACGLSQCQQGSCMRSIAISIHRRPPDQPVGQVHHLMLASHDQLILGCLQLGNFSFQIADLLAPLVSFVSEGFEDGGQVLQDHSRFLKRIYSLIIWALAPNADRQISDYILLKRLSASLGGNRSSYHRRRFARAMPRRSLDKFLQPPIIA